MGRSSKKQTRLTFNPLPSSSPATKGYNKQIQDRAATVSCDGASDTLSGWRESGNKHGAVNEELPTPAATLERTERESNGSGSESEPVRSSQRQFTSNHASSSRTKRKRQQPLDFSRVRDADSFDPPIALPSSSLAKQPSSSMFSSQARKRTLPSDDDDDSDERPNSNEPTETSKKEKKAAKKRKREKKEKRQTRSSQTAVVIDDDDDENEIVMNKLQKPVQIEDSGDDDEMPTTLGKQSRKRRAPSSSPPLPEDTDEDDDVIIVSPQKKRRVAKADSEVEDEDDAPVTPGRRRLKKKQRQLSAQEQADLEEDIDFIGESSDVDSSRRPRDSQSVKKNARLEALERLKRKRAGNNEELEPVEEEEEEEEGVEGYEGSENGIIGYEDNGSNEQDDEDDDTPQIVSSRQMFAATQEDEDFIEEDEDVPGSATRAAIPIQFTPYATLSAKKLFKFAIEWMVQKKINPAFQLRDELYTLTFKKLNDEVQGLAGSKFKSSAWTSDFTLALQARPELTAEQFQAFDVSDEGGGGDRCDACNRSGHPATYRVQFSGKPYNPETLEEVENPDDNDDSDSDSDSDSEDSDTEQVDSLGRVIPPASREYMVGRFCMANARMAHALQHWRWSLYSWVETWLDRHGYNTQEKVVERDRMKEKKRRRLANKIADRMGDEGVVKQLWREFRANIYDARNFKQSRFSAGESP
ncbi:Hypothetical protein R9X50_00204600 [Acrodontium crateriforme]|uniref:DUF4211 domain-containing protein n=1 Tax=Acrodontium crateriforme TaxID=150365 RepID=A0AAQ3R8A0_9PEZI|nr:Hypothetical protein R9X50_00204600 [Acrodontium crateriforme]